MIRPGDGLCLTLPDIMFCRLTVTLICTKRGCANLKNFVSQIVQLSTYNALTTGWSIPGVQTGSGAHASSYLMDKGKSPPPTEVKAAGT